MGHRMRHLFQTPKMGQSQLIHLSQKLQQQKSSLLQQQQPPRESQLNLQQMLANGKNLKISESKFFNPLAFVI